MWSYTLGAIEFLGADSPVTLPDAASAFQCEVATPEIRTLRELGSGEITQPQATGTGLNVCH